jgi:hypothetical protein
MCDLDRLGWHTGLEPVKNLGLPTVKTVFLFLQFTAKIRMGLCVLRGCLCERGAQSGDLGDEYGKSSGL